MQLKTRLRSAMMGFMAGEFKQNSARRRARLKRKLSRQPAEVHYFHQVDDPYSHLAVQKLAVLINAYQLPFKVHLVRAPEAVYQGDATRFKQWSLEDAKSVANYYGVSMPVDAKLPSPTQVYTAAEKLADITDAIKFAVGATQVGGELWASSLSDSASISDSVRQRLLEGDECRNKLGHYLSGMFYFDGEWYWGLDRLYLLEARLIDEGYGNNHTDICVPRPEVTSSKSVDAGDITLEYFPSLRSPYTAVGHRRVMDLVERTGVQLVMRPVMPMMMRGVPAPRRKQQYIMSDAGREARAIGVKFGNFVDPFGEPVKRAFALYPWMEREGKSLAYVSNYLNAAWADGIDITSDEGLKQVVESVGLSWQDAQAVAENDEWQPLLDDNVQALLGESLWGVPSFRVSGGNDAEGPVDQTSAWWGQDRLWRVEAEILKRATSKV